MANKTIDLPILNLLGNTRNAHMRKIEAKVKSTRIYNLIYNKNSNKVILKILETI